MNMRRASVCIFLLLLLAGLGGAPSAAQTEGAAPGGDAGGALPGAGPAPLLLEGAPIAPSAGAPAAPVAPLPETGDTDGSEAMGEFEQFITGALPEERLSLLQRYGISFFRGAPSTFAPSGETPVNPEYVVGPGDELRVTVWGMVEGSWNATVNRQGNISLPRVGIIGVAGLTFEEVQDVLDGEFSKYFSNYEMNVSLGTLKSMKIYITGNARRPGAYTLSSLATLVNALLAAGGPDGNGSLRKIQVKRGKRTVAEFDMYDFLMKGDKSGDIRLMPEDVLFIPVVGPQAAIAGNVRRPAIYELKGETSIDGLIALAGGMTPTGTVERIQVRRVTGREYRTFFEGDLKDRSLHSMRREKVLDGDFVRLFSVVEQEAEVRISGPVAKPGSYYIVPGRTRLKDVLERTGGLLAHAGDSGEITRVTPAAEGPRREHFDINVSRVMQGDPEHNILLQANDVVFLRSIPEWTLTRNVEIRGEVRNPGVYPMHDGERLSSLIERAGGFTSRAYPRGGVFTRASVREAQRKQVADMVERMERELLATGADEMSAVLSTEDAKIQEAEGKQKRQLLENLRATQVAGRITTLIAPSAVLKGTPYDLPLEEGDAIYIPANPSTVQVLGSVLNPSAFIYDKRFSHTQYIRMAGGYSTEASPDRTYILKADGSAVRVKGASKAAAPWVKEFGEEKWQLVEPGDAIIVPMKVSSYKGLRQTRDYLDMFYKLAITAATIHNVTK